MAITNEFREAVESGKKVRVRIMLKDMMLVDPTMRQFDEMLDFAIGKIPDLYDEHDEEELKFNSSEWNEAYLNSQMVAVVSNFSKERVDLLRNMVKYLYRNKAEHIRSNETYKPNSSISRKQIGIGVTAVGAAAAVAGICVHQGALIAGGVVVAAVGVGIILTDKEA
ncbi:hypothetical protein [Lacrimispora sp.]|uniref:hypothetical protein n=1 Tax=Lacrimispora sp. TaxID=2719234 RepID=UPI003995BBEE